MIDLRFFSNIYQEVLLMQRQTKHKALENTYPDLVDPNLPDWNNDHSDVVAIKPVVLHMDPCGHPLADSYTTPFIMTPDCRYLHIRDSTRHPRYCLPADA